MHLKRMKANKMWPITRKGNKFVVRPIGELNRGVPLLIVLRNMLKIGRDRKEIKQILNKGNVEVNGIVRRNDKIAVKAFDVISIKSINKTYSLVVSKLKKFVLIEKKDNIKIGKIIGKKILRGGKVQVNLNSGDNLLMKENVRIGDSLAVDVKNKKIDKILPLKEGSKVIVIKGKHIGEEGKTEEIKEGAARVTIDGEESNIKLENLMAI